MSFHSTPANSVSLASETPRSGISSRTSSINDLPDLNCAQRKGTRQTSPRPEVRSICCVGAGYVGGPTAAVIALKNPQIRVTVVDRDAARIARWNSPHLPVHEPGLSEVVRFTRDGVRTYNDAQLRAPNLFFTTNIEESIADADLIFLAVNTPTKVSGIGAGMATNMAAFESATRMVAQLASPGAIIVEKSTVPVQTAQMIREIMKVHRPGENFEILSNPEFLAEGTAIKDLMTPDRVLIGSMPTKEGRIAEAALADVYAAWVNRSKILTVNIWSSELSKLAANAMLAQRISSINSISAICESVGADINEVSRAIGLDKRIGNQFLKAGIGFGGSCFKKDILSLTYLARSLDLPEIAEYWEQVLTMNDFQRDRFVLRVLRKLNGTLTTKKVTVLGYAFKKDTNDSRESPAIHLVMQLLAEAPTEIAIFDPQCSSEAIKAELSVLCRLRGLEEQFNRSVRCYDDAYSALNGSAAALILTDWDQFRYPPMPKKLHLAPLCAMTPCSEEVLLMNVKSAPKDYFDLPLPLPQESPCPPDCVECSRSAMDGTGVHENLDWSAIRDVMSQPRWVFDGRGVVDADAMRDMGYRVESIGRV